MSTGPEEGPILHIFNEFAHVEVHVQPARTGNLLFIRDIQMGTAIALDPLELEALTRIRHEDFGPIVDPSFAGFAWASEVDVAMSEEDAAAADRSRDEVAVEQP